MEPHSIKVLLFGRPFSDDFRLSFRLLLNKLQIHEAKIYMYEPFHQFVEENLGEPVKVAGLFNVSADLTGDENAMLSIGGDGTFLEAITLVRDYPIPVAGINSGRQQTGGSYVLS